MIKEFKKFNLNEEIHFKIYDKLRDSIHDIIVNFLKNDEKINIIDLSIKLEKDYNIKINENVLIELLNNWIHKKDYTIFKKDDNKWLDYWEYMKLIRRKKEIAKLGKSRRKIQRNNFYRPY